MHRIKPSSGEIYHIFNRGVEKRSIFLEEEDYYRFVHDLYEFNDKNAAFNISYFLLQQKAIIPDLAGAIRELQKEKNRDLLVEILCFCLMPNHFHLVLRQIQENGIPLFMKKLGIGYAYYVNYKYQRVGPLFQGRYKIKHIANDIYFEHCCAYVHRNPLELFEPDWKEKGFIQDMGGARKFLQGFRFSSFPDYIGMKNFPSVTQRNFLTEIFDNDIHQLENFTLSWVHKEESIPAHLLIDTI